MDEGSPTPRAGPLWLGGTVENAPDRAHAGASATWRLSLRRSGAAGLVALLSDDQWTCDLAEAPWPPGGPDALPAATRLALRALGTARLRLQLEQALDDWPWERELGATGAGVVPRFVIDLASPEQGAVASTPLVAAARPAAEQLALVQAAGRQRRPLVLVDAGWPGESLLALERHLRAAWREPLLLSQALEQTLVQLGLPLHSCRLYGDGSAPSADNEQGWRPATALSIDVVNSTGLLQRLGAEAYGQWLQGYHELCRDVIRRLEGSLDKPQGDDGLMAYFGFPVAVEDAARRALTAAWQIARGMDEREMPVRIGVSSGRVAVSAQQAFASHVHMAASLRAAAAPGEILVAASTRERAGPGFVLADCPGALDLKGFGRVEGVSRLQGPRAAPDGAAARPGAVFVGRRGELRRLREAWATACTGCLQWCVVHGEAGIGKSRLLHEFARELRAEGWRCLEITGQAQAGNSPFAAVADALQVPHASGGPPDRIADELARLLAMLRARLEPGPACLLVDDAHWLDPSSVELLRRLRSVCAGRPLLLVSGVRSESGQALGLAGSAALELQGLTEDEAVELVARLGAGWPAALRRRVIERAEGVPLYLEESLRTLSLGEDTGGDVPATLEDLLMVRLDGLGPDRALAQLISVLGRECSAAQLGALLACDDPFIERARQMGRLESLLGSGLLQAVEDPHPGYRFKHAMVRDVAHGSLATHDRQRLHGHCADLIARDVPALWPQRPEALAQHLEAAGRTEPAWRAWTDAAQQAARRHAHQETVELAQRALMLRRQIADEGVRARGEMQLHLLIASAQIALRGYGSAEVEAAYLAAERAGARLADTAHALRIRLGLEACYVMRGDLALAGQLARTAISATAWDADARLALQSRWALANVQFHQGDWAAALAGFDDCLAHYRRELHRPSGVQDPAVMCLGYTSWIHFELGHADEALARITRILALAEDLQHPFSTAVALGFAASITRLCGDSDSAWPHAQEAVRVCERGGFQVWLAHAWMVRGQLRADQGDAVGGDEDMDRGYALWHGGGARISCATYLITRAEILLRQQRTRRAMAELEEAWRISEQIGEHYYQAELLRLQGLAVWQGGDASRAEQVLAEALALAERQRKPGLALRCALGLGALEARSGRAAAAARRLRGLLQTLSAHGASRDAWRAQRVLPFWDDGQPCIAADHTPWEPM